jgi:hypothetical protein
MSPFAYIARSTSLRRAVARSGALIGSYWDGACGRPARVAASTSVRFRARFEKYVCDAASTP